MAEMDVDMKVAAVPAMAAAPPPNAMQDTTVVRKTFPETWLWTNNTAGYVTTILQGIEVIAGQKPFQGMQAPYDGMLIPLATLRVDP